MKKRSFLCLAVLVLIEWTGFGFAQESKVPQQVWQKAQEKGVVRVIVQLDLLWQPEGKLSQEVALIQQETIATAQNHLLTDLAGTRHKIGRQFKTIPGIALEVEPDALAVVERPSHVVKVTEDRVGEPSLE